MRASLTLMPIALAAAVVLGCSGPRSESGGARAGARAPKDPVGLCMFDRNQGDVRRCLHFTFGRCGVFGDRCSEEEIRAQREPHRARQPAGPPASG